MQLGYIASHYPAVSHTFVSREIRALRRQGVGVHTFSIRRTPHEDLLTDAMHRAGMVRIDLLGAEPGLWALHPPFRSGRFYAELPDLVARIERGDVPDAQRGDHELNDSMIDWTDARAAFRRRRWVS